MAISHGFNKTEAATSVTAPVTVNSGLQIVVGTAPVNMLDDPEAAVNTPMLVNTFKEAAAAVGYSDDFAKYTLCEAVSASFQVMGISPIVVVNVLDPANAKHITELSNKTVQVNDGIAEIDETGILLKKLVVKKEQTVLTADEVRAAFGDVPTVAVCAPRGEGMEALKEALAAFVPEDGAESSAMSQARHVEAARRACAALSDAVAALSDGMPLDVAAVDLSAALDALGEITGETMS